MPHPYRIPTAGAGLALAFGLAFGLALGLALGLSLALGASRVAAAAPPAAEPAPAAPETAATALAPAPAPAPPVAAAARPDFSGRWQLDAKASDDPAARSPAAGRGRGGGRPGGGPGRGPAVNPGSGRMPGEGFDGGESAAREIGEAAGRRAAREFGRLEIFHAGDEFDLTDGMQVSRTLRIGSEPVEVFTPRGTVRAAAAWEGASLVLTERDEAGRVRRTRRLLLGPDPNTLTVKEIRHHPGADGDRALTLVYRRQDGAAKP